VLKEIQELRDALGNGAVHPVLVEAIERLHARVSLLENPAEPVPDDASKGGE
jgi:hypothetical protein